ncbi:MAG TPA: tetratricopeptide repeat protein [Treponemataceae bacterium]|nr:tetratricopeptide repeat protein [Treponemataceae bacterium]
MKESPEKLNTQAISLASEGSFKEAVACFHQALLIEKSNYLLWYNLGLTYRDYGNLELAKEALLQAYKCNEYDQDVIETLSLVCYAMDNIDAAFLYCRLGLEVNPENPHMWNNMGVFFFSKGEYADASDAFETALSIYPHYYDALYNLRDTYIELNNTVGSEECSLKLKFLSKKREKYVR